MQGKCGWANAATKSCVHLALCRLMLSIFTVPCRWALFFEAQRDVRIRDIPREIEIDCDFNSLRCSRDMARSNAALDGAAWGLSAVGAGAGAGAGGDA